MRTYGRVLLNKDTWRISGEPHLLLRLKRILGRVNKADFGYVSLTDTDETRREILWVMNRYPLRVNKRDLSTLKEGAQRHKDTILLLEDILQGKAECPEFNLAEPAWEFQKTGAQIYLARNRLLLADELGLGKTVTGICSLTDPRTLPAVVVTLAGVLPVQWEKEINRFAPALKTHVLKKGTPYELPTFMGLLPDVLILNYHKLYGWADVLANYAKSVVFDEIQELRRNRSLKYHAAQRLARASSFRLGLSATPVFNYGGEIWCVTNILEPDCLGTWMEFSREWCGGESQPENAIVKDARALGTYLREQVIMVRRSREDVGQELPPLNRVIHDVPYSRAPLEDVKKAASELARIILSDSASPKERWSASEELSWKLRQATGIAKAPHVGDFLRLLCQSGEKVLVYAWHRAVYAELEERLKDIKIVKFTGSESPAQKLKAKTAFVEGDAQVMLMSLRAGAGVDGLQRACSTVVFAELDWSAGVLEQCVGRIDRTGQTRPVVAYYLVTNGGSDPVVAETIGLKRQQVEGIRQPDKDVIETAQADPSRIRSLAEHYLGKKRKKKSKKKSPSAEVVC